MQVTDAPSYTTLGEVFKGAKSVALEGQLEYITKEGAICMLTSPFTRIPSDILSSQTGESNV